MTRISTFALLLCACIIRTTVSQDRACEFPNFLRAKNKMGNGRIWYSETTYLTNSVKYEKQKKITVGEATINIEMFTPCLTVSDDYDCHSQPVTHVTTWTCLGHSVLDNHYRIKIENEKQEKVFSCVKFIKRNDNVVQVYSAVPNTENFEKLCKEEALQRKDWPWISKDKDSWSECPLLGGFDFRSHWISKKLHHQELCRKVWRPSRLESECVMGEGMIFHFPQNTCNPFAKRGKHHRLYCWAHWSESGYIFIVLGQHHKHLPQYVMRLPTNTEMMSTFKAKLYFSPVALLDSVGQPPDKVTAIQLEMARSEVGNCYDEDPIGCKKFAAEGKCFSTEGNYKIYCQKSCNLCTPRGMPQGECAFSDKITKSLHWYLFENTWEDLITFKSAGDDRLGRLTQLNSRKLGTFTCKSVDKQYNSYEYATVSYYNNGCRPRYTCINFETTDDISLIKFRMSESSLLNLEIQKLCKYRDYPRVLRNNVVSKEYKILLSANYTTSMDCGIHGSMEATFSDKNNLQCEGHVSDWNKASCTVQPSLTVSYRRSRCEMSTAPHNDSLQFTVHLCRAFIYVKAYGHSILITQTPSDSQLYRCWIIFNYPERMNEKPWRNAVLLNRGQCGKATDFRQLEKKDVIFETRMSSDNVDTTCRTKNRNRYGKPTYGPNFIPRKSDNSPTNNRQARNGEHDRSSYSIRGSSTTPSICFHHLIIGSILCYLVKF
ncbi:DgyrCDS4120 [Dimorphilus gyrociliatus]|uniref:DgyrCDS4120 n=1 Tax=Dimorphilus gyrociliatus TaxID=2664684 RepID=A0A7I8VI42_9ANNE|nr:DgyrCDS4120 [Dimorphilus gyrociliatus]